MLGNIAYLLRMTKQALPIVQKLVLSIYKINSVTTFPKMVEIKTDVQALKK